MTNDKKHLDIDLDFLDKKESVQYTPPSKEPETHGASPAPSTGSSPTKPTGEYNWKNILIVGGIVLFFGWAMFSGSDSTSSSPSNSTYNAPTNTTNSGNVLSEGNQNFRCSDSDYDRAMQLKPSLSMQTQLANESATLDSEIAANKAEGDALNSMYVDESNQYEVDSYNSRVDSYNSERQRLIDAVSSWQQRSKAFDAQIDTYNNYLDANCTPQ